MMSMCKPLLSALAFAIGFTSFSVVTGATTNFVQKITASDAAPSTQFGFSINADDNRFIVGQLWDSGSSSGSAYMFEQDSGGTWNEVAQIIPTGGTSDDNFGYTVSLSGDLAVVGADGRDGGTDPGSAYVFSHDVGSGWQQEAKLLALDGAADDEFGISVGIDGSSALVGAYRDDDDGNASGSAYAFDRDSLGNWTQSAKLTASDAGAVDQFGWSVGISGNTAIVGAFSKGSSNVGGAYIFQKNVAGIWNEIEILTHSDAANDDRFGWSVAIDGNTAIVGAVNKDSETGAAYVFRADGSGNWNEVAKLAALDADPGDAFGFSVELDGEYALVGAWLDDEKETRAGAAYLFREDNIGNWDQISKLTAFDALANDRLGKAVTLANNGVFVGSPRDDDGGSSSGAVYIYEVVPEPCSAVLLLLAGAGMFGHRAILATQRALRMERRQPFVLQRQWRA